MCRASKIFESGRTRLKAIRNEVDPVQLEELESTRGVLRFWGKQLQSMAWNTENEDGSMIRLVDKPHKTAVVKITNFVKHPLYKKYVRKTTKVYVHDEKNECKVGEKVMSGLLALRYRLKTSFSGKAVQIGYSGIWANNLNLRSRHHCYYRQLCLAPIKDFLLL